MTRSFAILGHRGDIGGPENSLTAFRFALEKADGLECDIHLSSDGVPVILHDATLERTTTGDGAVATTTYAELQQYRLKDRDGAITDDVIPSLEALLSLAKGFMTEDHTPCLNLEIKDPRATEAVIETLQPYRNTELGKSVIISSFDHDILRTLRGLGCIYQLGLLFVDEDIPMLEALIQEIRPEFLHPAVPQLPKILPLIESYQLKLVCWIPKEKELAKTKEIVVEIASTPRLAVVISNFPVALSSSPI